MKRRPAGRSRLDTFEPKVREIPRVDERVDGSNGVLLVDPVVQALRQKRRLTAIWPFNEPLHEHPRRIIKGIIERSAFSHSQGQKLTSRQRRAFVCCSLESKS